LDFFLLDGRSLAWLAEPDYHPADFPQSREQFRRRFRKGLDKVDPDAR